MTGEQVLIVEDNQKNMKLFRDVLLAKGYRTLEATTGGEAVELALLAGMIDDPRGAFANNAGAKADIALDAQLRALHAEQQQVESAWLVLADALDA